jgi:hypothetical protein
MSSLCCVLLALAGYWQDDADLLLDDLRTQLLPLEAEFLDETEA